MEDKKSKLLDINDELKYKVDNKHVFKLYSSKINFVFLLLILTSILLNFSNGSYENIQDELKLDFEIENELIKGLITSTFAIGSVLGFVISLFLIENNVRKFLLIISILLCFGSSLTVGIVNNFWVFVSLRFVNGIGVSFIALLNPVWIDQFSVDSWAPTFMALHNLSSIIGNIGGFGMSSLFRLGFAWNKVYLFQSFVIAGLLLIIFTVKKRYFDDRMTRINNSQIFIIRGKEIEESDSLSIFSDNDSEKENNTNKKRSNSINNTNRDKSLKTINSKSEKTKRNSKISSNRQLLEQDDYQNKYLEEDEKKLTFINRIILLIHNKIYLCLAVCIVVLLFVSNTLINETKGFLREVYDFNPGKADIVFIVVCVTSPISGITVGGIILRNLGGYHSIKAMYLILFNTTVCSIIGILTIFIKNYIFFGISIWTYLFLGAMIDPCVNGYIVRVLPLKLKGTGFAFMQIFSGIFAICLCPIFYNSIYQVTKKNYPTMAMGLSLSMPIIATLLICVIIKERKKNDNNNDNNQEEDDFNNNLKNNEETIKSNLEIENNNLKDDYILKTGENDEDINNTFKSNGIVYEKGVLNDNNNYNYVYSNHNNNYNSYIDIKESDNKIDHIISNSNNVNSSVGHYTPPKISKNSNK